MRLLRLAFIPSLAVVLSCGGPTEERQPLAPNPVQPLLGNPIAFPTTPVLQAPASPTPTPRPSTSPTPSPTPTPTPTPSPTPTPTPAPTPTPTPTPSPTPTPTPTPSPTPTPTPSPSPSATPPPGPSGIHHLRVAFFGILCKNGKPEPNNGAGLLPVGCKGSLTATPKYANGDDVPATIHGPNIAWELETGGGIVQVKDSKQTIWNKDLIGLKVGTFSMCATVRDVRGCLNGTVTP